MKQISQTYTGKFSHLLANMKDLIKLQESTDLLKGNKSVDISTCLPKKS